MSEPARNRKPLLLGALALVLVVVIALVWKARADLSDADTDARADGPASDDDTRRGLGDDRDRDAQAGLADRAPGVILGQVSDLGGEQLPGARVCARRGRIYADNTRPRCVETDAEGRYQIAELAPGEYRVHAGAAEHQPLDLGITLRSGAEARADFELLAGAVLVRGFVHDLSGGPIEGAVVTLNGDGLRGDPRGMALAQTNEDGDFEVWVRRGRLHIYASAGGYATRNIYSSAPGPTIELYLVPEAVIVGRIVDAETGAGVADVAVQPGRNPLDGPMKFTETAEGRARSDANGDFRIAGLVPGSFQPYVNNGEYRGVTTDILYLGLGETSEPIELRVTRAGTVRAQVVDAEGAPACVGGGATASPAFFEFYNARVDDEGWVELGGLRPGDYGLNLHCWGRMLTDVAEFTVPKAGGALEPQTWTIDRGLPLSGVVVDGEGNPVPRVILIATKIPDPDDDRGPTARKAKSEPTTKLGEFRLDGLESGAYELEVGGSAGPKLREPVEVEIQAPGVEDLRVELPVSGQIRGRVVSSAGSPVANISVSAYGQSGGFQDAHSDDEGGFTITGLGPDSYRLVAIDGRWNIELGATEVALEAGASAEAEIEVGLSAGVIRGTVVDDGGTPLDDAFITLERQAEALDKSAPEGRFSYADFKGKPVLTDPDGRFEITALPEGLYTVRAKQSQGGEVAVGDVAPGDRVELVIPELASVSGVLVLAGSDAPIADYAVTANHADGQFSVRAEWRERDGSWAFRRLPPGSYTLIATSPLGDAQTQVELAPGAALSGQRIELAPRVEVRGQIVEAGSTTPIADAEVRIAAPGAESMGVGRVAWVTTDAEGRFRMTVPQGELPLRVIPSGSQEGRRHESLRTTVEVGSEAEQDLGAFELTPR